MRFVRYSLLALTVLISSTITTGARAQEREYLSSPEAKSMSARAASNQAGQYEYKYQHRLARLRRLQQIAQENNNKERLERLDQLYDKLESKRRRHVDARRDHLPPKTRDRLHDRLKSKRAENVRHGVIERHQDRHELRDTFVKNHRQAAAERRDNHRQNAAERRDDHRQAGIQRRENHRDAAQQRRARHQEARQEKQEKHHKAVKRNRGDRVDRGERQHRQRNNREASYDARQNQHGRRGENVESHRDQNRRDPSSMRDRRSLSGNRHLETRNNDLKQSRRNPKSRYRKPLSKKPAHNFQSRHTFDDEIRRTITSKNANAEFERLIREIEGGS